MMRRAILVAAAILLAASPGSAQLVPTGSMAADGINILPDSVTNPHPVNCVTGCGGGSGGATTIANGADIALGSTTDAAAGTGTASMIAILKQLHLDEIGSLAAGSNLIGSVSINPSGNIVQPQGFAPFVAMTLTNNCYAYASPATVFFVGGYAPQANLWVLVYNLIATPADGTSAMPMLWFGPFPSSGDWNAFLPQPVTLTTGMTLCYSTTGPGTKTSTSGITAGGAFKGNHN